MDFAVRLEDVYKEYPFYHHITAGFKSFLFNLPRNIASMKRTRFTALSGVSFDVKKGETFGIIGRNGSGKSTMLGLIAGVIKPDRGMVKTSGKISSLLELGAGFHPDLSGMENIILNGILMGNTREEMLRKMGEIIEFSELGDFIYQPLRTYSSGMHVRLGFSVAVHTAPEILLVDEALAVGDLNFQEKCMRKMGEFRESGATIIIVSHGMSSIAKLCDRAAWLDKGVLMAIGKSKEVIMKYLEDSASPAVPAKEIPTEEGRPGEPLAGQDEDDAGAAKPAVSSWWDLPVVASQCEVLITGDPAVTFYDFLRTRHLIDELDRGLSICHQLKGMEVDFMIHNICKSFDIIDDEDKLRRLTEGTWNFRERQYDLVLCVDILHRIKELGPFLDALGSALRDDGVIIALEYVGPANFRYSDREIKIAGMIYDALREGVPSSPAPDEIAGTFSGGNPVPALERVFNILAVQYFGGPLYDLLLNKIIYGINPGDKKDAALTKAVMMFERILIKEGALNNSYAVIIARKKAFV